MFELEVRKARLFSEATLVPAQYQQNIPNCLIALNMARRMNADPLMVMQNLHIVKGKPGWSGQFLIATFNQCGRFSAMRFEWRGAEGMKEWGCRGYATELATGNNVVGSWVTWKMVEAEGWSKRDGSKWLTMAEQMFLYRAGAFLVRAYAPEIAMGLPTAEELVDTVDIGGGDINGAPRSTLDAVKSALRTAQPGGDKIGDGVDVRTAAAANEAPPVHRGRGRPRKNPEPHDDDGDSVGRGSEPAPDDNEPATQAAPFLFTYAEIADVINKAKTHAALDDARAIASDFPDPAQRTELLDLAKAQGLTISG